jgi:diguanylate cyclase (GGDEF)-like protein
MKDLLEDREKSVRPKSEAARNHRIRARWVDRGRRLRELTQLAATLTSERDVPRLLDRIVDEARRVTSAEAATLFVREGDALKFAVVRNDALAARYGSRETRRRLQEEHLDVAMPSLAGYVATTGEVLNVPDAYAIRPNLDCAFDARLDARYGYLTRSVLAVPLHDASGNVLGVLQLLNARDGTGTIRGFERREQPFIKALASLAAVAIRTERLEELSCKDPLTDVYNRRYFMLRVHEEAKRHERFGEPLSLVLLDIDHFKVINDRFGHGAGDRVLKEVAQLLVNQSRNFTIVTRLGGDEFGMLLVNTPKAGAVTYAQRMRGVIERYPFKHGPVTASLGVASLPEDAADGESLIGTADRALYRAKHEGRNGVGAL